MATPTKLEEADVRAQLSTLPGWTLRDGKLHREYSFADFTSAFGFMASAALVAQAMDHHPDWFNAFNVVRVDLSTHDVQGISSRDLKLAHSMELLARRQPMK
jgi:4a-hydroxytetrahydrobiopterin dehydratase